MKAFFNVNYVRIIWKERIGGQSCLHFWISSVLLLFWRSFDCSVGGVEDCRSVIDIHWSLVGIRLSMANTSTTCSPRKLLELFPYLVWEKSYERLRRFTRWIRNTLKKDTNINKNEWYELMSECQESLDLLK